MRRREETSPTRQFKEMFCIKGSVRLRRRKEGPHTVLTTAQCSRGNGDKECGDASDAEEENTHVEDSGVHTDSDDVLGLRNAFNAMLDRVEYREVRLDVTTLCTFSLVRYTFGFYASGIGNLLTRRRQLAGSTDDAPRLPDGTSDAPLTVDLGFDLSDIVDLARLAASASSLCLVWILFGTLFSQFTSVVSLYDSASASEDDEKLLARFMQPTYQTVAFAGPAWQALEQGVIYASVVETPSAISACGAIIALGASMVAYRRFCYDSPT